MPEPRPVPDTDRLPWLEPSIGPASPKARTHKPKPSPSRRSTDRVAALLIGGVMLIGGLTTGYWLGQQPDPQPLPKVTETIAVAPVKQEPVQIAEAPAEPVAENTETVESATPAPVAKPAATSKRAGKKAPSNRWLAERRRIRAQAESSRLRAVKAAQERRAARRAWPKMPSPGPAGQVIQLGAFSHPDRAYSAYHARIARYPALAQMPRVIVPVARGRRGSLLYVLRLGTASRQQSHIVCRNLRRSGDHCLVIG